MQGHQVHFPMLVLEDTAVLGGAGLLRLKILLLTTTTSLKTGAGGNLKADEIHKLLNYCSHLQKECTSVQD